MFTAHDVYSAQLDSIFNDPCSHIKRKRITNPLVHLIALVKRILQMMQWQKKNKKNKCPQFQYEQKNARDKAGERRQHRSRTDMWREDCWHQKTSFTYRFIVCKLQTCFILHCSFAEVNSWERQRETERLVIEADRDLLLGFNSPKWPCVYSFNPLNCTFKLACKSQRSLTVHGVWASVVCSHVPAPDFWCLPVLSSSLHPFC